MIDPETLQRVVERLLEDESLTADLIDEAAKVLLDWGLARADAMVQQETGEILSPEEFDAQISQLRRTMKCISKQASEAPPDAQTQQVQELLAEIETADGMAPIDLCQEVEDED
jgi:chaperonin cofactor prefoldin